MDKLDKTFLGDILMILFVLGFTIVAYARYPLAGILLAGSLALAVLVVANILLFRRT